MRRILPSIAFAGLALVSSAPAAAQCRFPARFEGRELTYTFQAAVTPAATVLHVTLAFTGGADGQDKLYIPIRWAGESFKSIGNVRATSRDTVLEDGGAPEYRMVRYPANQPVIIEYDVTKDWTGRLVAPLQFHAVIMPDYVEFTTDNGLVFPLTSPTAAVTAHFDWRQLPANWIVATSFGTSTDTADRCQSFTGAWVEVQHALFAAGEFRVRRFTIGRRAAVLAIRGDWTFTDDEAIAAIQRTVGVVRDFWRDDDFPYFLVTMKAYDQDSGSSDGSAFTNAFWMYMSRKDPITAQLSTLAHESFHAWNLAKMGTLSSADDRATQWFKEGFTRYYADVLLHQAGVLPLQKLIDDVNADLKEFPASTSAYVRGRIVALWLDGQIRSQSTGTRSLDDVMRDMVKDGGQPITLARILSTAGRYVTPETAGELQRAVVRTDPGADLLRVIPERMPTAAACAQMTIDTLPTFDLGFDFGASRTSRKVTGVVVGGPAYQAGMRDGQDLRGFSFNNGQIDKPATFSVSGANGDQTLSFLPAGTPIAVPQYHAIASAACSGK